MFKFILSLAVALLVSWRVGRWFAGLRISNSPSGMTSSGGGELYEEHSVKSMTTFIFFMFFALPLIWVFYFSVGNGKNDWCSQASQRNSEYCKDTQYYVSPRDYYGKTNAHYKQYADDFKNDWCSQSEASGSEYCKDTPYYVSAG